MSKWFSKSKIYTLLSFLTIMNASATDPQEDFTNLKGFSKNFSSESLLDFNFDFDEPSPPPRPPIPPLASNSNAANEPEKVKAQGISAKDIKAVRNYLYSEYNDETDRTVRPKLGITLMKKILNNLESGDQATIQALLRKLGLKEAGRSSISSACYRFTAEGMLTNNAGSFSITPKGIFALKELQSLDSPTKAKRGRKSEINGNKRSSPSAQKDEAGPEPDEGEPGIKKHKTMQVLFTLDDFDHESIFLKRGDMHFVLLAALKEHSSLDVTELQETLNTYEPDVFLQHYLDVQKNRGWVALSRGRYSITKKGLNVCDKLDELVGDRVYFSNEDDLEDEEEDSPGSEQGDEDDSPASEAQVFHPHNDRTPVVVMISGATKLIFLEHGDVHFAVLNEVFHEDGALNKNDLDMYLAEGPVYQGYPQRQVQRGWLKLDRDNRYHITEDGKLVHAQLLEKFGESEDYDEDDQDPMQKNEDEPLEIVGAQAREKVYFCITPQTIDHLVSVAVNAENFITDFQQRAVETLTSELSEKLHTFYDQSTSGDFIELVRERFKFDLKSRQGENWVDINPGRKTPIMVRLMAPQRQRQYFHTTESMQELLLKQLDTEILSKILTQTTILDDLQKPSFDLLTRMVGRVLRDSFSINPGPYFKELIQENFKIVLSRKDGNLWYELGN